MERHKAQGSSSEHRPPNTGHRTLTAAQAGLKIAARDLFRAPAEVKPGEPMLRADVLPANLRGLGQCLAFTGQGTHAYRDALKALGCHGRRGKIGGVESFAWVLPIARLDPLTPGGALLQARVELVLAKANNAKMRTLLGREAAVLRLEGQEAKALAKEAEAARYAAAGL